VVPSAAPYSDEYAPNTDHCPINLSVLQISPTQYQQKCTETGDRGALGTAPRLSFLFALDLRVCKGEEPERRGGVGPGAGVEAGVVVEVVCRWHGCEQDH
jgi:hypothetical protein